LEKWTPYIERALTGDSEVQAKIGKTWLIWDGWEHPLDIRLEEVSLLTPDGETFSTFPQISLGLDLLALPFGRVLPTSLLVSKPIISLKQHADKSFGFHRPVKPEGDIDSSQDTLAAL